MSTHAVCLVVRRVHPFSLSCILAIRFAQNGGALFIANGATLDIKRTAFLFNNASKSGGAFGFFDATATLTSNTIAGNLAMVSGRDIFVQGNTTRDSTGFVNCRRGTVNIFPNLFCDGGNGTADGGGSNTNCGTNLDSSGTRCALT
jgi:hypothetical protein